MKGWYTVKYIDEFIENICLWNEYHANLFL